MRALWLVLGLVVGVALAETDHYSVFVIFLQEANDKLAKHGDDVDKLMFSELVEAAELGELKQFVDRVGLAEVLKFSKYLDEDDSRYFTTYLEHLAGYKHEALDHHGGAFDRRQFLFPGGFLTPIGNLLNFNWFLGELHDLYPDLPSYERELLTSLTTAVRNHELTKWIEQHGYGAIFDIIAELNEDHAREFEQYVEKQLAEEKKTQQTQ